MSRIYAPPNSTSLVMLDLLGSPKFLNLQWRLLNTTPTQLICILVLVSTTKIVSFFATYVRKFPFNWMPKIKVSILATYIPLNMDIFHPSLFTRPCDGAIFRGLGSFCFAYNFECSTCGSNNISTTMFLVISTRTPYTTNFIMSVLNYMIHWINYLTSGWVDGCELKTKKTTKPYLFCPSNISSRYPPM